MSYQHILVAVDLSEESKQAVAPLAPTCLPPFQLKRTLPSKRLMYDLVRSTVPDCVGVPSSVFGRLSEKEKDTVRKGPWPDGGRA